MRGARELARHRELAFAQLVGECAVAAEVRREEHRVEAVVLQQGAGRADEAEGVLLARAGEVDRVRGCRGRRQRGAQNRLSRVGEHGQVEAVQTEQVARDRAVAAAVAHDPDAPAAWPFRRKQRLDCVDELSRRVDAMDAGSPAGRVDGVEVARQRAGV